MAISRRERALAALHAALDTLAGTGTGPRVERETPVPDTVPVAGLVILRDGDPGEPEITLSPLLYTYDHRALVEVMVHGPTAGTRAGRLDALLCTIGDLLVADPTLGGAVEDIDVEAPDSQDMALPGAPTLKGALVTVILTYSTDHPLH